MSRQRQVYPRDMVAHLFANRAQDSAREASGSFYFTGPTLYSYGSHFVVAFHMPERYRIEGAAVVLVNSASYSNTTSKHQHAARYALRNHGRHVYVCGISENETRDVNRWGASPILAKMRREFCEHIADAAKPRIRDATRADALAKAQRIADDMRALAACDVADKKGLAKKDRDASRATLRGIPADVRSLTKEQAQALNLALNKADILARADMALMRADGYAKSRAENAEGAGAVDCAKTRGRYFNAALYDAELAAYNYRKACDAFTSIADMRKAKAARTKAEEQERAKAEHEKQRDREAARLTADTLRGYNLTLASLDDVCAIDRGFRDIAHAAERLRRMFEESREFLGDDDAARILPVIQQAEKDAEEFNHQRAAQAFHYNIENARSYAAAGHFRDALRCYRQAFDCAERAGEMLPPAEREEAEREHVETLAKIEAKEAGRVDAWRAGARDSFELPNGGAALRIAGDRIETSRGAWVPLSVAPLVWRAVNECRANKTAHEFGSDAPTLGHFRMTRIDAEGAITVGCHWIAFDELQRVADALGYEKAAA